MVIKCHFLKKNFKKLKNKQYLVVLLDAITLLFKDLDFENIFANFHPPGDEFWQMFSKISFKIDMASCSSCSEEFSAGFEML